MVYDTELDKDNKILLGVYEGDKIIHHTSKFYIWPRSFNKKPKNMVSIETTILNLLNYINDF